MPIKLNTASGGGVILTGANTASDKTITVPAVDGTMNMSGAANEVPAGSASAPAIYSTGDTNTGIFFPAADTIAFSEGGAESMRIDSSGNFMVGATTKSGKVTSNSGTTFDPGASGNITNTAFTAIGSYGGGVTVLDGTQGYTMWAQASGADFYIRRATTSSAHTGGVYISNAAGSWSSASDERLKNIIRPIENATEKLSDLRCVIGEYKDNIGAHHPFLIAQDVQAVFPEVVNHMNEEGHLGMSYTDMVPILVKAIQEQQQMIETLQAKVAALEAK